MAFAPDPLIDGRPRRLQRERFRDDANYAAREGSRLMRFTAVSQMYTVSIVVRVVRQRIA
jgi:hypothetical protein